MTINPHIFRAYDIRGLVDKDLTKDTVSTIGKAFGTYMRRQGKTDLVVGRDGRHSSPQYAGIIIEALRSTGCDVTDVGMVPTPVFYYSILTLKKTGGVMITGSHNPPDFNGFKLGLKRGTLYGPQIQEVRRIAEAGEFESGSGKREEYDITPEYIDYLVRNLNPTEPFPVAVDSGNGTAGVVAPVLLRRLGFPVTELFSEVDGNFPHHFPDPTIPENLASLIETVRKENLRIGLAYDGDADRLGVIDSDGTMIWGDRLMILFSRDILARNPGASIIMEVKSSQTLYDDIEKHGGRPIIWKTGHSNIKKKMKEENALLGGEMSGHLFFADRYFGYDDAIYASGRLLEILSAAGDGSIADLLADVPPMISTPEIRVDCPDETKFEVVEWLADRLKKNHRIIDVDGVRVVFPNGWGLIRASNTQPVLVLRFEADTENHLNDYRRTLLSLLAEKVSLPDWLTEGL